MAQATPEWFLLRVLSLTSSSFDRELVQLKKLMQSDIALIDPAVLAALHSILNAIHGAGWQRGYVFIFTFKKYVYT